MELMREVSAEMVLALEQVFFVGLEVVVEAVIPEQLLEVRVETVVFQVEVLVAAVRVYQGRVV